MVSPELIYCFVCGTGVSDLDTYKDQDQTSTFHIFRTIETTKCINERKTRKKRSRTKNAGDNNLTTERGSAESKTNEGVWLEKIMESKLEFNPICNSICYQCVGKVHHYQELSDELEMIRQEVLNMWEARSQKIGDIKDTKLSKTKIKKIKKLKGVTRTRPSKNPSDYQRNHSKTENENSLSEKDVSKSNDGAIDTQTSQGIFRANSRILQKPDGEIINPKGPFSSRRSVRIKASMVKATMKENEDVVITNPNRLKEQSEIELEDKGDGEIIPPKNFHSIQLSKNENAVSDKSNESKQLQLKQTSIMDKNTSHPCEICKF